KCTTSRQAASLTSRIVELELHYGVLASPSPTHRSTRNPVRKLVGRLFMARPPSAISSPPLVPSLPSFFLANRYPSMPAGTLSLNEGVRSDHVHISTRIGSHRSAHRATRLESRLRCGHPAGQCGEKAAGRFHRHGQGRLESRLRRRGA